MFNSWRLRRTSGLRALPMVRVEIWRGGRAAPLRCQNRPSAVEEVNLGGDRLESSGLG